MVTEQSPTRPDTRARIVEAAARLLQEHGPAAVTTRAVAHAAGVQAPAIYRLFGDKDGLIDAVAEHVMATYVSSKRSVVDAAVRDGADPLADLRAGWRSQMEFGLANPTLFVLLSMPDRTFDSPAIRHGAAVLRERVQRIAATGALLVSEARAVDLIRAAGTGAVLTLLAQPTEQRDLTLADAMFDAVLREIVIDSPEPTTAGPVSAAVALRAQAPDLAELSTAEQQLLTEWLDRVVEAQTRRP